MARRHEILAVSGTETIIGSGVRLKGNLTGEGDIVVDGRLVGDIKAEGNVNIGLGAIIKGDITGVNIHISGRVAGNLKADGEVSITETGYVQGDIASSALSIGSGAVFIGRSHMVQPTVGEVEAPTLEIEAEAE